LEDFNTTFYFNIGQEKGLLRMTGHLEKQSWFSETLLALGLLLKASLQSLMFSVFGGVLAPFVLIAMLIGKFPNAVSAVYSAIIIIPLLVIFPFQAIIYLALSLFGRNPNYRMGVYGAAQWIDEVKLSDPTSKRKKGKWPLIVKLAPILSILLFIGIIIALPNQGQGGSVSNMSFEERLEWEAEKIDYLLNFINDDRPRRMAIALKHGWSNSAKDLIEKGFDKKRALQMAAGWGSYEIVKYLVDTHGVSVGLNPALSSASGGGHLDIVRLLLERGVKINIEGLDYGAPLHRAASRGRVECVQVLIDYGAKVNLKDKYGGTPLHHATRASNEVQDEDRLVKTIGILLSNGADVNAQTEFGNTPLHYIVQTPEYHTRIRGAVVKLPPRLRCAKLLMDHSASLSQINKKGKTPLNYANNEKMYQLLTSYTVKTKK
jgi:ankyrin repeat protein